MKFEYNIYIYIERGVLNMVDINKLGNGHIVLCGVPAPLLFQGVVDSTIRLSLPYPDSPNGKADIYVHKNCVRKIQGRYVDATYNVLLVDSTYFFYYRVHDDENDCDMFVHSKETYTSEYIQQLTNEAIAEYNKHPIIVPKQGFFSKLAGEEYRPAATRVEPPQMIRYNLLIADLNTDNTRCDLH